jgi:hypothetical protein
MPQNYTAEVLDDLFHNLNPAIIRPCPPHPAESMNSDTRKGMLNELEKLRMDGLKAKFCSMEGLYLVLKQCPRYLRQEVIQTLLPRFDILDWYIYFLLDPISQKSDDKIHPADPGRACSILFLVMQDIPPVKRWLLELDKVLIYALQAWTAIEKETGTVYASFSMGNYECPQGRLLQTFLRPDSPDAPPKAFDWLPAAA